MPKKSLARPAWDPVTVTYERIHVTGRYIVRPTRIEGTVGGAALPGLPNNVYPIALYPNVASGANPVGAIEAQDMPIGYHRGHIMARALGGPNDPYNLAPMPSSINNGTWAAMENALKQAHNAIRYLPQRIYFRANLGYATDVNAGDPTLPTAVEAWGYQLPIIVPGAAGIEAARTVALDGAIAAGAVNLVHRITPPANFANAAAQPFVFNAAQINALTAVQTAYSTWANAPLTGGGNTAGRAAGGRGDPPANAMIGPYSYLDVIDDPAVGGPLIGPLNAAFGPAFLPPNGLNYPGGGINKRNNTNASVHFRDAQKRLIRLAHMWRHTGRFFSDNYWYEQNRRLGIVEVQIDHIIPQNKANSSNYYWNAQVVSHAYNTMKSGQDETAVFNRFHAAGVRAYGPKRKRKQTQFYTPSKRIK